MDVIEIEVPRDGIERLTTGSKAEALLGLARGEDYKENKEYFSIDKYKLEVYANFPDFPQRSSNPGLRGIAAIRAVPLIYTCVIYYRRSIITLRKGALAGSLTTSYELDNSEAA
ncbi:hypothetical protein RIF29_45416 [Crotalaria pallida]|uniref:Uncharacterized protein n=1 Tax=Crotalaria pallida TaxID=3830 RepID=A0AAN9DTS1_CROPI